MFNAACSITGCVDPVGTKGARGMCPRHYQRWLRVGEAVRSCETCGAEVTRSRRFCSDACKPRCSVPGCDDPTRKRGWCASHYAQRQRSGAEPVPFEYKWSERTACLVCGKPSTGHYRQFCSAACRFLFRKYDGTVPTVRRCIACGVGIDLTKRGKGGQRRKSTVKFCRPCKQDYSKYKLSAAELAVRDGIDCGICGAPVDMSQRRADSNMCASVDHIIPRALGGTHEPGNLQLAHLHCNQVKSDGRGAAAYLQEVI